MKQKIMLVIIMTTLFIIIFGYLVTKHDIISNFSDFFMGMTTGITSVTILIWIIAFIVAVFQKSKNDDKQIGWMPKNQMLLSAGMICMFTGSIMVINHKDHAVILFFSVILFILSMIFNIIYIRKIRTSLFCR